MEYKVGDIVRGLSDEYGITNREMTKGEVIEADETSIKIKVLEHQNKDYIGENFTATYPDRGFEILAREYTKPTVKELFELPTGTMIKTTDKWSGNQYVYLKDEDGDFISSEFGAINEDDIDEGLWYRRRRNCRNLQTRI